MSLKNLVPVPWDKPRRCPYCKLMFQPRRIQDLRQKFCCKNHCDAYHKRGTLPYNKMVDQIVRTTMVAVEDYVAHIVKRTAELEAECRRLRSDLNRVLAKNNHVPVDLSEKSWHTPDEVFREDLR